MKLMRVLIMFSVLGGLCSCGNTDQSHSAATVDSATMVTANKQDVTFTPVEGQSEPYIGQYCYIKKVYKEGDVNYVDADFIQFLMGDKAIAEAKKRGEAIPDMENGDTTWSLPDGYYILNENTKLRKLKLADDFKLTLFSLGQDTVKKTKLEWLKEKAEHDFIFVLTMTADSTITAIKDQYLP